MSSRRRHTRYIGDWSSDVCSSDLTKGGINGRKINLLSVDDAYSPPKTVEGTRKLVESDQVLAMVNSMGTAAQTSVQKYLNAKQVRSEERRVGKESKSGRGR